MVEPKTNRLPAAPTGRGVSGKRPLSAVLSGLIGTSGCPDCGVRYAAYSLPEKAAKRWSRLVNRL
jgi:hypothetical protein